MMDDVLAVKADRLLRCVKRIEEKKTDSLELLQDDLDVQDIIILNLERAVQQAVDIVMHLLAETGVPVPDTMREAFDAACLQGIITEQTALNMKHAVGFRNTAVHAYQQIDCAIVFAIITKHLDDFRTFLKEIVRDA